MERLKSWVVSFITKVVFVVSTGHRFEKSENETKLSKSVSPKNKMLVFFVIFILKDNKCLLMT